MERPAHGAPSARRSRSGSGSSALIALTGNRALTGFTAPKLLWLRDARARGLRADRARSCCRRTTCGCGCAASRRSTSPTPPGRCCSTSPRAALERRGARGARASTAAWLPRALESPEVSGETPRRRARSPPAPATRRRARSASASTAPAAAVGRARHVRRRVRGAAGVRRRPRGARARVLPRGARTTWHAMGVMLSAAGSLRWLRDATARAWTYDDARRRGGGVGAGRRGPDLPALPRRRAHAARRPRRARRVHRAVAAPRPRRARARGARGRGLRAARLARPDRRARRAPDARARVGRRRAQRAVAARSSRRCSSCRSSAPRSTRAPRSAPRCSAASRAGVWADRPRRSRRPCARPATVEPVAGVGRALPRGPRALPGAVPGAEGRAGTNVNCGWVGKRFEPPRRPRVSSRPRYTDGSR